MKTANQTSHRLRIWELALMAGLGIFLLTGAMALEEQEALSDRVVRLHVLANSDSPEDQALKLQVRDRIVEEVTPLLEQAADRQAAEEALTDRLLTLRDMAEDVIEEAGYDYPVTVQLADTVFPTREYEGFALPAGEYLALRVLIGEGAGQNWWCVVFPPLCTAQAAEVPAAALAAGLTEDQVGLITEADEGYQLRFKSVELWEALKERFS